MKKLILILAPCVMFTTVVFSTPSRLVDGKPQIAVADVNGRVCWTQKEKDDEIFYIESVGTRTVNVQDFTLAILESAIVNSGIKFDNYSDYQKALTNRQHLEDKISDLKPSEARKNQSEIAAVEVENSKR